MVKNQECGLGQTIADQPLPTNPHLQYGDNNLQYGNNNSYHSSDVVWKCCMEMVTDEIYILTLVGFSFFKTEDEDNIFLTERPQ